MLTIEKQRWQPHEEDLRRLGRLSKISGKTPDILLFEMEKCSRCSMHCISGEMVPAKL